MGASIGAALRRAGVQVLWVSAGRGPATRRRAQAADLTDAGTLPALVARSDLVLSVCPPHAAIEVASRVAVPPDTSAGTRLLSPTNSATNLLDGWA